MTTLKRAVNPYLPRYTREELEARDDELCERAYEAERRLREIEPEVQQLRASIKSVEAEREQIAEALAALDQ